MPRLALIIAALLCCAWTQAQPSPTPAPPQYAWNLAVMAGGHDASGPTPTPTATPTPGPGGSILWSEDFNAELDDITSTTGTMDDDCTAVENANCPLNGAQSVELGPDGIASRWIKDNAFTNRQTACISMTFYPDTRPQPEAGWSTVFFLRSDGGDASTYALQIANDNTGSADWKVHCSDAAEPPTGGDFVVGTASAIVLDIDMANGDMDLYLDGASTATVACDGSGAGTFDGIKLLIDGDAVSTILFDDILICENAAEAGVCSCS
jgi:hypothetical protein